MKLCRQLLSALSVAVALACTVQLAGCQRSRTATNNQSQATASPTPALPDWIGGTPEPPPKQP